MSEITVVDRDGQSHDLKLDGASTLMEVLRDQNLDVDGTCGGAACCGSCHVFLDDSWIEKLPADEMETLTIEGLVHGQENSRLSCQINTSADLSGIKITLAPSEI